MTINSGVNVKFSDSNLGLYSSLIGNGWQQQKQKQETVVSQSQVTAEIGPH